MVQDINVEKVTGLAQIQVEYNRDRLAQYGLSVTDVNSVLRTAFAGSQAGVVFDEEKRFGLVVRLDKDYRQSLDDIKNLTVALHDLKQIPFDQVPILRSRRDRHRFQERIQNAGSQSGLMLEAGMYKALLMTLLHRLTVR